MLNIIGFVTTPITAAERRNRIFTLVCILFSGRGEQQHSAAEENFKLVDELDKNLLLY